MSRYKCHPIPIRSQGGKKTTQEEGEAGCQQGSSRDSWDKACIVPRPQAVPIWPLSPALQDLGVKLHLDSNCSVIDIRAGMVVKLSWEVRPAKGAPTSLQPA